MLLSTQKFLAVLFYAVSLYYPQTVDQGLKPPDTPPENVRHKYDFIIVGAGSAGCVVANRLSEIANWTILLIEAGGDEDFVSDTPFLSSYLYKTDKDWNYTSVKQKNACLSTGGVCSYTRGRVMGGSSTINYMLYVRGNRADYNGWAEEGNAGWSYEEVLPYFIKAENNTITSLRNSPFHGHKGYLNVQRPKYRSPLKEKFIEAGLEFGWDEGDYNGARQDVISDIQVMMDGPSRESNSKAYLDPISMRQNLDILKHAVVTKIILDGSTAKGVQYYRNGKVYEIYTEKEIILSAGSIDTPKLLMLSGIGPKQELLGKHNIAVKVDLPVGEFFQDHVCTFLCFEINSNETLTGNVWKTNTSILQYAKDRDGPLTSSTNEANAYLNVFNKSEPPNLQLLWCNSALPKTSQTKQVITVVVAVLHPKSRGTLKLKSNNWIDPPLIDPNFLSEDHDVEVLEKGINIVLEYMKTPTMSKLEPKLYNKLFPLCPQRVQEKNKKYFVSCMIHKYSTGYYHPVGSSKMGSVVTNNLEVRDMKNLRVVDASVIPQVPRANTNAAITMIAEKASDIIKLYHNI